MKYMTYLFTLTLFFAQANSWGKIQDFKIQNEHIKVEVPDPWTASVNTFDVPISMSSKMGTAGSRSVVQIVPLGKDDGSFKKLTADPEEYIRQKEAWLAEIDGKALSFDEFNEDKINGATIYSVGSTYQNDLGTFHDRSYYVVTKNKSIYYLKTFVPADLEKEHAKTVVEVVRSIASVEGGEK